MLATMQSKHMGRPLVVGCTIAYTVDPSLLKKNIKQAMGQTKTQSTHDIYFSKQVVLGAYFESMFLKSAQAEDLGIHLMLEQWIRAQVGTYLYQA